jgi:hypothetical protein
MLARTRMFFTARSFIFPQSSTKQSKFFQNSSNKPFTD